MAVSSFKLHRMEWGGGGREGWKKWWKGRGGVKEGRREDVTRGREEGREGRRGGEGGGKEGSEGVVGRKEGGW